MSIIVDLKHFIKHIKYNKSKMKTFVDALKFIQLYCWMASVDLKDAFYGIPKNKDDKKYVKFERLHKIYRFTGMPNSCSKIIQLFIRILIPLFHSISIRISFNDSCLQGATKEHCM